MDEHDDVIERLKALGRRPVDPALQSAHLTAMAAVRPRARWSRVRVAAAFLAGLLLGGSGLAAAGALPDPAQNVAHKAFAEVGVQVPQPERYHDAAECGDEVKANHGAYVRDDKSRAKTDCGKPVKAGGDRPGGPSDRGPCQGPPPWALDKSMTDGEKTAAQAQRAIDCPDVEDAAEAEDEEFEAPERSADAAVPSTEPTTTTTAPASTTTTTAPDTEAPVEPEGGENTTTTG